MTDFEIYRRTRARSDQATATLSPPPNAMIRLSGTAYELLGSPERVTLLWNRDERIIGVRPARAGEPFSYPCRKDGQSSRAISARAFFKWAGIESDGRRRSLTVKDGVGYVDLRQPGAPVRKA